MGNDGIRHLFQPTNKFAHLKFLNLSGVGMNDNGLEFLADCLCLSMIEELYLDRNGDTPSRDVYNLFTSSGLRFLYNSSHLNNLRILSLRSHLEIGDLEREALLQNEVLGSCQILL